MYLFGVKLKLLPVMGSGDFKHIILPSVTLAQKGFSKGVYHVFPTLPGAHMVLLGNVFSTTDKGMAYLFDLMQMINAL